jgi:hypothetical protein
MDNRMTSLAFRLIAVSILAGCSKEPVAPPAGARLQPWELQAEGAPALRVGILDTREDVHCTFRLAADGQLRCLPIGPEELWPSGRFADAACQAPFWSARRAQGLALSESGRPVALPTPSQGCQPRRHGVVSMRALPDGHAAFTLDGGRCVPDTSEQPTPSVETVDLVVERTFEAARWALGTETDGVALTERLSVRDVVTDDGARFATTLVDSRWQQPCRLAPQGDRGLACWPSSVNALYGFFADATCAATPLVWVPSCERPAFIQDTSTSLFEVGAPWTGTIYQLARTCAGWGQGAAEVTSDRYVQRGAPLGADALSFPTEATTGTGRFRLRGVRDRGGAFAALPSDLQRIDVPAYADMVTGEDCWPAWTTEGRVRCIPKSVNVIDDGAYFADAGCTTPVLNCIGDCARAKVLRMTTDENGRPLAVAALTAGAGLPPTNVYVRLDGACKQVGAEISGLTVAGDEIPLDTFPALTERNGEAP